MLKKEQEKDVNSIIPLFLKLKQKLKISSEDLLELIKIIELQQKSKISTENLAKAVKEAYFAPIEIFKTRNLAPLETLVKYLKENLNLKFNEISKLLNRTHRAIWGAYKSSIKKQESKFIIKDQKILVPISIFSDRNFSILESLVKYLKEELNLSHHEIALILVRDDRTIWTVYSRARKKYEK